jgi:aminopeptidase N
VATENRVGDARRIAAGIGPILDFYAETIGEFPFPKLTVAVVPSRFPAGHSPGGLTVVGTPSAPFRAEDNPAIDRSAPAFQLAHELAHQWWGQAVGWRNYRHQWLSEAFAQYFAALYVRHASGEKAFGGIVGWLDAWARRAAGRGPVDLGVRAGAITGERWLFPAVVYDRGALALDALRRKVGDDAFFRALRSYYRCRRFDRADTDDLRTVMEATSGSSLESFFAFWIDGDDAIAAR